MPFSAVCPGCRAVFELGESAIGRAARCKRCQQIFTVAPPVSTSLPPQIPVEPFVPAAAPASPAITNEPPRPPRPRPRPRIRFDPPRQEGLRLSPHARRIFGVALVVAAVLVVVGAMAAAIVVIVAQGRSGSDAKGGSTQNARAKRTTQPAVQVPPRPSPSRTEEWERDEPDEPLPRASGGQLSARVLKDLKGATVFIKVEAGKELSCSGSGFLVKTQGNTGYIVTNHHVVNPEAELLKPIRSRNGGTATVIVKIQVKNASVTAVFNSGTPAERSLAAEVVTTDASRDLAILRVTGPANWPRPIILDDRPRLVETMPVYILGFPFGEALSFKHGNPAITVNKGSISSLRQDDYGQMKAVQIDGAINPGNSGGPVVDETGHLVGISVATIKGSGIGLAIAPEELDQLFKSQVR